MPAIRTEQLRKVYQGAPSRPGGPPGRAPAGPAGPRPPGEVVALEGLDLEVREGEFFGLLGPNGAGKTTTLSILTTRARPTAGRALVAGADVVREATLVKQRIGVVPQRPNADRALGVRDNLLYHAAYHAIPAADAARRADRLLARFDLAARAEAPVDALSGGQQQRLMIARALMHEPRVIFLDEPTVGLDPQVRLDLWAILRELHAQGATIVITTHYMEEADRLCDRVAIIDRGTLLALDTPAALKAAAPGGTLVELLLDADAAPAVAAALEGGVPVASAVAEGRLLRAYAERGGEVIPGLIRAAERAGRQVLHVELVPPSLETLFVSLTGRKLE